MEKIEPRPAAQVNKREEINREYEIILGAFKMICRMRNNTVKELTCFYNNQTYNWLPSIQFLSAVADSAPQLLAAIKSDQPDDWPALEEILARPMNNGAEVND